MTKWQTELLAKSSRYHTAAWLVSRGFDAKDLEEYRTIVRRGDGPKDNFELGTILAFEAAF